MGTKPKRRRLPKGETKEMADAREAERRRVEREEAEGK